ncbi:rRNA methyltransferase 3A, mitochondrial [Nerophis lumbriciformis]|uniref:rRNA methyltransferase 3A, mitochondrial n=1 Tax=Nerophis lumbriciformis TaxID=546530 RepID=UPI002ADFF127|nr:rRNA methyltransferase 3A, mitochondrial-like [Nerophis lumbriciformis]
MAMYMKYTSCLFSVERGMFLSRASTFSVECKRYVRGLRRRPVKVMFPTDTHVTAAGAKGKKDVRVSDGGGDLMKERSNIMTQERSNIMTKERSNIMTKERSNIMTKGRSNIMAKERSNIMAKERSNIMAKGRSNIMTKERSNIMTKERSNISETSSHVADDNIDGLPFERASPGDKRLARLVSVARSRTFREQQGKVLLEGRRLICDALNSGAIPQTVFVSTADRLRELPLDQLRRASLVKVKFEDIKLWSDLVAPQGVIAIFSRPDASRLRFTERTHCVPLTLICDQVRDPGNLGTMLRCAAAAGCHSVLLTKGCVDVWEPKVLRAAMGAHFHLPIYSSLSWEEVEDLLPKEVTVHVADSTSKADGSNHQTSPSHAPSKAGDLGWVSVKSGRHQTQVEEDDCEYERLSVDTRLYHQHWAHSPTALVVGGETEGLSIQAIQVADKTKGHRLCIPIVPAVDSLNSAMAASILLFEGRKQLLEAMQTSTKQCHPKLDVSFPNI